MIAFLTSSPAVGQDHTRLNPANGLVSELEKVMPRPARGLFVCSDPDDFAFTDRFAGEMFAAMLASEHNLAFYLDLVREARRHIEAGDFSSWKDATVKRISSRI